MEARKISFQEAWDSSTIFFIDEELEAELDTKVSQLLSLVEEVNSPKADILNEDRIYRFLIERELGLDVLLMEIELSVEKFLRIISLLRKLGDIRGGFESEWGIEKVKSKIRQQPEFAQQIVHLLLDGKREGKLEKYIPRYYLETLNYRQIRGSSQEARRVRYKKSLIGTYAGRKGYKVERRIKERLAEIQIKLGVSFEKGRTRIMDTDIDFVLPGLEDPWVIIMSSFQETTSSGQTTKARDMLAAYEKVIRMNSRYNENRAFVNFVDGGGWLARKRDFQRLVEQCHYFINLAHLDMLEDIIQKHIPAHHFKMTQ